MSWFRSSIRTRDQVKQMEAHYRVRGYDDGYAGRPCASKNITYAQAWKSGREARRAEGEFG